MEKSQFNADIWRLNNNMVELMLEVNKSLIDMAAAIKNRDSELMAQLIAKDKIVNAARDEIEGECLRIIMKRHPFAMDLRQVLGTFKIISDVERISDNIRDICEAMQDGQTIFTNVCAKSLDNLFKIGDNVIKSFDWTVKAYATLDTDSVDKVVQGDDIIDELYNLIKEEVTEQLESSGKGAKALITMVSATKHYEKIGDHCVNIAEWVRFILRGERKDSKKKSEQIKS